jgi:hypothetical protein
VDVATFPPTTFPWFPKLAFPTLPEEFLRRVSAAAQRYICVLELAGFSKHFRDGVRGGAEVGGCRCDGVAHRGRLRSTEGLRIVAMLRCAAEQCGWCGVEWALDDAEDSVAVVFQAR